MATTPTPVPNRYHHKSPSSSSSTICPSVPTTVRLHDWFLIKVDIDSRGRRLGVGGFASTERQEIRAFHSAAIGKRHDTVTLETVDGLTVLVSGLINWSISHQNGFPSKVCNRFQFGFPYDWETYSVTCFSEESLNGSDQTRSCLDGSNMSTDDCANSLPISLDDLPVTRSRDLLMSTRGEPENCLPTKFILNDILEKCRGENAFKYSASRFNSGKESTSEGMTEEILDDNHTRSTNVSRGTISSADTMHVKETRVRPAVKRCRRPMIQRSGPSEVCLANIILYGEGTEMNEFPSSKFIIRRSRRLKNLKA